MCKIAFFFYLRVSICPLFTAVQFGYEELASIRVKHLKVKTLAARWSMLPEPKWRPGAHTRLIRSIGMVQLLLGPPCGLLRHT